MDRWPAVQALSLAMKRAKQTQLEYVPERTISVKRQPAVDSSRDALDLIDKSEFARGKTLSAWSLHSLAMPMPFS
jgi:hypothetical protein